jgi:DNA-binding MarR family transcriptional regulator
MSNKQYAEALARLPVAPAQAKPAAARLMAVANTRNERLGDSAFEAPFKWNMVYLLARVFYEVKDRTEAALGPYNLTPMQFTLLASLSRSQGLCSAELSRRFGVTPQTMGEMIGNLERRGLIVRQENPANRRALLLGLSDAGEELVASCTAQMRKMELEMFSAFSPSELHDLRERLISLHEHFGLQAG